MVDASLGRASTLTRPPTPPRESAEDSTQFPVGNAYQGTLGEQIFLNTPEESPSSSAEYHNGSGGKPPKRVVFSPWTSYHKPLPPSGKTAILEGKLRLLPPSKDCTTSHKSILKVSTNSSGSPLELPRLVLDPSQSVAVMFQSMNHHLNSALRDSRLDSYRTLLGCLSAYEEVPETKSIAENLTGFLEYARRDIFAKHPGTGSADVELASNALKVLATILYTPGLTDAVPYEFATFIVEQAVSCLESHDVPKVMLDHYMQLLARQKLPPKVINSEKASRILNALNGLETRVKGNRVVGLKLMIYQRLHVQVKSLMVPRAADWLGFLISSLSSSIKDIRSRAIAFGSEAALALGTTTAVSQACLEILDRDTPSGPKIVDCLGARLLELLNVKNEGFHVPQIWIIIILFIRSRRRQVEKWDHLTGWLGIMQRAFNSSDAKIKLQANIAWNQFVSVVNIDASASASFIRMIRQPIACQLERKNTDSRLKHAKQLARSTYCNLLYYSFSPGVTHEQLDLCWDAFVVPVLAIRPSMTKSDLDFACEVLGALLHSQQPKVWDQNRAHEQSPMKVEELPCLDPKWIRSRVAKISSLLEDLFPHRDITQSVDVQEIRFSKTWVSFVKAIGDAASKEVKVSMETMTALAHIVSLLNKAWNQSTDEPEVTARRLNFLVSLVNEAVAKLGFRSFAEKRIIRSTGHCFQASETPTSRTGRPRGSLSSPVACIIDIVVNSLHISEPPSTYSDAIETLLAIALRAVNGRGGQLVLLQELAVSTLSSSSKNVACRLKFWECLTNETARGLSLPQVELGVDGNPQYPGYDYREAARLLEPAIREFPNSMYTGWKTLSDAIIDTLEHEGNEEGILLVYTEPLAELIHERGPGICSNDLLKCCTHLLHRARWPTSRQTLERARKLLWGPASVPRGPAPVDPYHHVYLLLEGLLITTYSSLPSFSFDLVAEFISAVDTFLVLCPLSLRAVCLKRLQRGLAAWIEDGQVVAGLDTSDSLKVAITTLRKDLIDVIMSVPKPDSSFLADIEDLLIAGFQSRHQSIVNDFVFMWSRSFTDAESLEYPAKLRDVLAQLRCKVDIGLPGIAEYAETEIMSSPYNFIGSQDEHREQGLEVVRSNRNCFLEQKPPRDHFTPTSGPLRAHTPDAEPSSRKSESTPKGRSRHDDSQVQFAAIDSSPPAAATADPRDLTDRQKEVREGQKQGAAIMFPDIRSSPRTSWSAERPSKLVLHGKQAFAHPLDPDADPSPTFPPGDTAMNDFLVSSPTPSAGRRSPVADQVHEVSLSSPLGSPHPILIERNAGDPGDNVLLREFPGKVAVSDNANSDQIPSCSQPKDDFILHNQVPIRAANKGTDAFTDSPEQQGRAAACSTMDRNDPAGLSNPEVGSSINVGPEQPLTPRRTNDHMQIAVFSRHHLHDGLDGAVDSAMPQAPVTPTEDEQAREQLLRDLEVASSQADSHVPRRRPSLSSPSEAGKKRKDLAGRRTRTPKAVSLPASFVSCEVVVEKRKADEENDDCIIVDDRPAVGEGKPTPLFIKQERSPSPVAISQPSFLKTPAAKNNPTRRRTRSMMAGDSSPPFAAAETKASSTHTDRSKMTERTEQPPRKKRRTEEQESADHATTAEDSYDRAGGNDEPPAKDDPVDLPIHMPTPANETVHAAAEDDLTSSQVEELKKLILNPSHSALVERAAGAQDPSYGFTSGGDTVPNTPHDDDDDQGQIQPTGANPGPARSPGQRMLDRFMLLLHDIRHVTFWPEEERQMVEVAFEVVKNVHDSGRKNTRQA
ncbi:MAG: hypothetical protein Q9219_000089 [cf. Caloplaca sp. 3 TL-2023]